MFYSSLLENNTKRVDLFSCCMGCSVSAVFLFHSRLKTLAMRNTVNRKKNLIPPDA